MPLTLRITFEEELKTVPPPLTLRRSWPAESHHCSKKQNKVELKGVPKPAGEVGRLNRGGYRLTNVLGLNGEEYKAIQV